VAIPPLATVLLQDVQWVDINRPLIA